MFCNKCGKANPDDARFCSSCGYRFPAPQQPEAPIPTAMPIADSREAIPSAVIVEQQSVKCHTCGIENPAGVRYCKACAKQLLKECRACKSWNALDAEHCSGCGKSFLDTQSEHTFEVDTRVKLRKSLRRYVIWSITFIGTIALSITLTMQGNAIYSEAQRIFNSLPKDWVGYPDLSRQTPQVQHYYDLSGRAGVLWGLGFNVLSINWIPFSVGMMYFYYVLLHWSYLIVIKKSRAGKMIPRSEVEAQATGRARLIWMLTSIVSFILVITNLNIFKSTLHDTNKEQTAGPAVTLAAASLVGIALLISHSYKCRKQRSTLQ